MIAFNVFLLFFRKESSTFYEDITVLAWSQPVLLGDTFVSGKSIFFSKTKRTLQVKRFSEEINLKQHVPALFDEDRFKVTEDNINTLMKYVDQWPGKLYRDS